MTCEAIFCRRSSLTPRTRQKHPPIGGTARRFTLHGDVADHKQGASYGIALGHCCIVLDATRCAPSRARILPNIVTVPATSMTPAIESAPRARVTRTTRSACREPALSRPRPSAPTASTPAPTPASSRMVTTAGKPSEISTAPKSDTSAVCLLRFRPRAPTPSENFRFLTPVH